MPCHFILGSSLLTVVLCLPPVHLGLMTFVALPHLSITTVISLLPALCRWLHGSRNVFSLLATLRRSLPHRIISSSLALWLLLGIGSSLRPHSRSIGCSRSTLHSPCPSLSSNFSSFFFLTDSSPLLPGALAHWSLALPYTDVIR